MLTAGVVTILAWTLATTLLLLWLALSDNGRLAEENRTLKRAIVRQRRRATDSLIYPHGPGDAS